MLYATSLVGAALAGLLWQGAVRAQQSTSVSGNAIAPVMTLALQTTSKSWVRGATFDELRFATTCASAGVRLVPPGTTNTAGTIVIVYAESRGSGFSPFGVGNPVAFGTDIQFRVSVLDRSSASLVSLAADAETPAGLEQEALHDGAREALFADPAFRFACVAAAAVLGAPHQASRLLPWAVVEKRGLSVLQRLHFQPSSRVEGAYWALAQRKFRELRDMAEAIDPLSVLLQNSGRSRDGIGVFPATTSANATDLVNAIELLAAANEDDQVVDSLTLFLADYGDYRTTDNTTIIPVLSAALRALGVVGTRFTEPLLGEWEHATEPLAAAARSAHAVLRRRLETR